jgi:hypothetical protein
VIADGGEHDVDESETYDIGALYDGTVQRCHKETFYEKEKQEDPHRTCDLLEE